MLIFTWFPESGIAELTWKIQFFRKLFGRVKRKRGIERKGFFFLKKERSKET